MARQTAKKSQNKGLFPEGVDRAVAHTVAAGALARELRKTLPPDVGFLVVTFDYGGPGHMGYAATGDRADCIRLLREFLAKFEGN